MIVYLLLCLALAVYGCAFAAYAVLFVRQRPEAVRLARPLLALGMGLHLAFLLHIWVSWGHAPLSQRGEALLTATLLFFVSYLVLEIRLDHRSLGVFILGVGLALFGVGAMQLDRAADVPAILRDRRYVVHVLFAITGYSGLVLAAIASSLFLLLRHEIRVKRLSALYRRLPSLETLDRMALHATGLGLVMLTIGIVLGAVFLPREEGPGVLADRKILASGVVWAINAAYLYGRAFRGWQRRKAAWISVAGLAALLLSVSVVPLLPGVFHKF